MDKSSLVPIPFEARSTFCISGVTGCGKTNWTWKLLKHRDVMFKERVHKILWCFSVWQDAYDQMQKDIEGIEFHHGLPSSDKIQEFAAERLHSLIVLDDMVDALTKNEEVQALCTRGCHHLNLSAVYLTQNLYQQGRCSKTIQVNTYYNILMKSPRDISQIDTLSRQAFKSRAVTESYLDCMKTPWNYLVVDMSPHIQNEFRLRSGVFPGETCIVYLAK